MIISHREQIYQTINALFESATKFALVACISVQSISYLLITFLNPHDQQIMVGASKQWEAIALLVVGFYFGKKATEQTPNTTTTIATTQITPPDKSKP